MPQDTALNDNLTISDIINYFGALYRIPNKECKAKAKVLCERLGLPEESRSIGQLSGGQKRRVSFICTLIHKPRLMILDEPTVGCDPNVIEVMWRALNASAWRISRHVLHHPMLAQSLNCTNHFIEKLYDLNTRAEVDISRHVLHHPMLAQSPILNVDPIAEPELEEDQYNSRNYFIQVFTMHWTFFVFLYLSISTFHDDITTPLYERSISAGSTPTQFILSHLISSLLLPSLISLPVMIFIIDIFHATAKAIVTAFLMATMKLDMFIVLCCASENTVMGRIKLTLCLCEPTNRDSF
uniref:ABC transporter domain-containing protein n=1 Tax=Tetranychus urticae TaxID=32264 RepID=T1KS36_TETUR